MDPKQVYAHQLAAVQLLTNTPGTAVIVIYTKDRQVLVLSSEDCPISTIGVLSRIEMALASSNAP